MRIGMRARVKNAQHRRGLTVPFALALIVCANGCRTRLPSPAVITRSTLIFKGTVQELHASRAPEQVKPGPNSYVIRVDEIYAGRETLQEYVNRDVTIVLTTDSPVHGSALKVGKQFVFLAAPLVYARSLVLQGEALQKKSRGPQIATTRSDLLLANRVRLAETIVKGRVISIRNPASSEGRARQSVIPETEHDPQWQIAVIAVESYAKQPPRTPTIEVSFPTSEDIAWYKSPRYRQDQSGIWLLRTEALDDRGKVRGYTAVHPLDFLNRKDLPGNLGVKLKRFRPGSPGTQQPPAAEKSAQ